MSNSDQILSEEEDHKEGILEQSITNNNKGPTHYNNNSRMLTMDNAAAGSSCAASGEGDADEKASSTDGYGGSVGGENDGTSGMFYDYWKTEEDSSVNDESNDESYATPLPFDDMQCFSNEMIMRPPSSSILHYHYPMSQHNAQEQAANMNIAAGYRQQQHAHQHNQHQLPAQRHHGHGMRHQPAMSAYHAAHAYGNAHQAQHGHAHAAAFGAHHHQQQHHPHHVHQPNMWYPNTPQGYWTGGSQSGYAQRYGYSNEAMESMLQLSNSGREARNRAEKNRRDKLNSSIQELSTMVPHVSESPRRVDKTAVLRFAAHGLRLKYVFGNATDGDRSPALNDALMKLLDSIFITLTCHGQIVLISSSVEQHLGHCQADLYGQNLLNITHPDDHNTLKQQIIPTDLENLFDVQTDNDSDEPRARTPAEEEYIDQRLNKDKRSFTIRLARAGPRSEATSYEVVRIEGCFRRSDTAPRGSKTATFPSSLQLIRRSRGRENTIPLHCISGNDIVLVAIARIIRPPRLVNHVSESNKLEYKTRHLIDGRIVDCDQRISLVAGYMTSDVRNLSPFTFMHQDDARWVIVALRQMYDCSSSYGESTYRLITRNGNFIYLQSRGYLEIDKQTNKVHSFVCINTLLDEEDGKRRLMEMKKKFSIIINTKIPQTSIDVPASQTPLQLEKAVMCLIQNLQHSDAEGPLSPSDFVNGHYRQSTKERNHSKMDLSKTATLSLIPPEVTSVKNSIQQSVNAVNITAAKMIRHSQQQKLSVSNDEISDSDCQSSFSQNNDEPSRTLKRHLSCSQSEDDDDDEFEEQPAVKHRHINRTEFKEVLNDSLNKVQRSLKEQLDAAMQLRCQSGKYEVPNSAQQLDELMEEHQKQSEMFNNIKSEYDMEMQSTTNTDIDTTATNSLQHLENDECHQQYQQQQQAQQQQLQLQQSQQQQQHTN